jgi:outer membrane immunogenic protein
MMKYVAATLVAGTALASTPALAQDTPFTGLRVEALGGYDSLRSGEAEDDGVESGDDEGDETIDGVGYGVGVGFDFDLGGVVLGVEGELSSSTGEQEASETIDDIQYLGRIKTGRDFYVGARLGFAVTPQTLIYAKGGYTNAAVEVGFESDDEIFQEDTSLDGWRLGGGIEQVFGRNLFAKVEYRYSNYSSLRFDEELTGGEEFNVDVDLDRHQVMAGIGIRF